MASEDREGGTLEYATSIQAARRDQAILVDAAGQVRGRDYLIERGKRLGNRAGWIIAIPSAAAGLATGSFLTGIGLAFAGLFGFYAFLVLRRQRYLPLQRAHLFLVAGRRAEALAELDRLPRRMPPAVRAVVMHQRACIAWLDGRHDDAIALFDRRLAGPQRGDDVDVWLSKLALASVLVIAGKLERARALRGEVDAAPQSDLFDLWRMYVDLRLAFREGDVAALADADLYEWSKLVLSTNLFGGSAALLAWAFDGAGDRDMARHMLRESISRLPGNNTTSSDPELHAWIHATWTAWGLDAEDGPLTIP